MTDEKPSYEDLENRLAAAEALIEALKGNQVDAIIGPEDVSLLRSRLSEEKAQRFKAELERLVAERTRRLRNLTIELTQAEQRERQRLAELLHDHLQQLIAGARLRLSMLEEDLSGTDSRENLKKIEELMAQAMQSSRSLCQELSPPDLFSVGLQAALDRLAGQMKDMHGLSVCLDCESDAEPDCENVRILLFQIVRELLFNVVKHGGTAEARVALKRCGPERLQLLIADDGVGFDPEKSLKGGNGGFGLFSIQERLEALGGRMDIDSAPGNGSRFNLYAPLYSDDLPAAAPGSPLHVRKNPDNTARQKAYRVLIADDHKMFREGLVSMLGANPDIEIIGEAHDGQMAVELARKLQPDVVVMDISMPRLNGVEATRIISGEMPDTRVIALSMHLDEIHGSLMRRAGAEAFLTKDGPLGELVAAIQR